MAYCNMTMTYGIALVVPAYLPGPGSVLTGRGPCLKEYQKYITYVEILRYIWSVTALVGNCHIDSPHPVCTVD